MHGAAHLVAEDEAIGDAHLGQICIATPQVQICAADIGPSHLDHQVRGLGVRDGVFPHLKGLAYPDEYRCAAGLSHDSLLDLRSAHR